MQKLGSFAKIESIFEWGHFVSFPCRVFGLNKMSFPRDMTERGLLDKLILELSTVSSLNFVSIHVENTRLQQRPDNYEYTVFWGRVHGQTLWYFLSVLKITWMSGLHLQEFFMIDKEVREKNMMLVKPEHEQLIIRFVDYVPNLVKLMRFPVAQRQKVKAERSGFWQWQQVVRK